MRKKGGKERREEKKRKKRKKSEEKGRKKKVKGEELRFVVYLYQLRRMKVITVHCKHGLIKIHFDKVNFKKSKATRRKWVRMTS